MSSSRICGAEFELDDFTKLLEVGCSAIHQMHAVDLLAHRLRKVVEVGHGCFVTPDASRGDVVDEVVVATRRGKLYLARWRIDPRRVNQADVGQ